MEDRHSEFAPDKSLEGATLPNFSRKVNRLAIAWMAVALEDPNEIHVEDKLANEAGFDTVVAHGTFPTGVIGAMITNWAGPGRVRSLNVRVVAPTFPGDTLVASGQITSVTDQEVTAKVWVDCDDRRIASGVCVLAPIHHETL